MTALATLAMLAASLGWAVAIGKAFRLRDVSDELALVRRVSAERLIAAEAQVAQVRDATRGARS